MNAEFTCKRCKLTKPVNHDGGTGYGENAQGERTCYMCIADLDRAAMIAEGTSRSLPLYLSVERKLGYLHQPIDSYKIGNWPGTLEFHPHSVRFGSHNLAGKRTDVWFAGPDGHVWHGVQIGEWNQVLHAKRTKDINRAVANC